MVKVRLAAKDITPLAVRCRYLLSIGMTGALLNTFHGGCLSRDGPELYATSSILENLFDFMFS